MALNQMLVDFLKKERLAHEYEIGDSAAEVQAYRDQHLAAPLDPEEEKLDAEVQEIVRLAGITEAQHQDADKLAEALSRTDVEILRRYVIEFLQGQREARRTLDRIAHAIETFEALRSTPTSF
jgi:hypothetical protein